MFGRQQERCDYTTKGSLFLQLRYALHATLSARFRVLSSTDSPPSLDRSQKYTHTHTTLCVTHAFRELSCTQFSQNAIPKPKHPLDLIRSDALYIHIRPKDILIQSMISCMQWPFTQNKRISYWLAHSPNAVKTAPQILLWKRHGGLEVPCS